MSLSVTMNTPVYPPGTEISVAGIAKALKNGETTIIDLEQDVVADIENVVEYLKAVTGATVTTGGESTTPPPPVVLQETPTPEGGEQA